MVGKKAFMDEVIRKLKRRYKKEMRTSLEFLNPWELLVATILSAQSQDAQVNKVTRILFRDYKNPKEFAALKPKQLYTYIGRLGLYRGKARNIISTAKILHTEFKDRVPGDMDELVKLPGVGRKTANVVLGNGFHINEGIAIDTHCITTLERLGITKTSNPKEIEAQLIKIVPRKDWTDISHLLIALGRDACTARTKYCDRCVLNRICPSSTVK